MNRIVKLAMLSVTLLGATQLAQAQPEADVWYQIKNVASKKNLALDDKAKKENGALIVQRAPGTGERQQWKFVKVGAYYKIINRQSGQALNVQNAAGEDGTPIIQWDAADEGKNQQWTVEKKGDHYVFRARHSNKMIDVFGGSKAKKAGIVQWAENNSENQAFLLVPVTK